MENNNTNKIKSYDFYYELRSLKYVQAIWLYGSRARGDNQERSDIDLAILCPTALDDDWRKIMVRYVRKSQLNIQHVQTTIS